MKFRLQCGNVVKEDNGKYFLETDKDQWKEIPHDLYKYFIGTGATPIF